MKKSVIFSVMLVILLAMGLALVSCDIDFFGSDDGNVQADDPLILTGKSCGKTVTVTISQTDPSKAVLTVKGGEFYEIKLVGDVISKGKISVSGNDWLFTPSSDSPGTKTSFSATYSNDALSFSSIPGSDISSLTVSVGGDSNTSGDDNNDNNDNKTNSNNNSSDSNGDYVMLTGKVTIDNTSPEVGDTLTATYKPGNGTGYGIWRWMRGDTYISTSTNSNTYVVADMDYGKTIKVQVTFPGFGGDVTSAATDAVSGSKKPGSTPTTPTTPPPLEELNVHIRRSDSSDKFFVFSVDEVSGAGYYEVIASGTHLMGTDNDYLLVPDVCLTDRQLTTFTVQAVDAISYASLSTDVPGMVKYPDDTKNLEKVKDWFNFLEAGLYVLDESGFSDTTLEALYDDITDELDDESSWDELYAGDLLADSRFADLDAATATVLEKCDDISNYLVDHITEPGIVDYYIRFYEAMDRLWFNEVTDTANNAKLNGDIVGPRIKAFFPAVKTIE